MSVIVKRDVLAHFRSVSNTFILFLYFVTGAVFWAASLGGLVTVRSYFTFLIVGLMVLGVYNTSYNYMNVVSTEMRRGYVKYLLALPLNRGGLTLGRVVAGALQGILYLMILLSVGVLLIGPPTLIGVLLDFAAIAALSFCLSSLGIAIAVSFKPEINEPMLDILGLLLIYSSTLYYPLTLMPEPLRTISQGNVLSSTPDIMSASFG